MKREYKHQKRASCSSYKCYSMYTHIQCAVKSVTVINVTVTLY